MRPRLLASSPLVFAGAFLVLELVTSDPTTRALMHTENIGGKALCWAGCTIAALAFDRGDYLRRAWSLLAACQLVLLVRDATLVPAFAGWFGTAGWTAARDALVVGGNAAAVVGTWMLARAWSVAGLDSENVGAKRAALFAAGLLIALLINGWAVVEHTTQLLGGDLGSVVDLASDIGDAICFALVVPVLQTALALRGGELLWPWALLTAGVFCWVLYDVAYGAAVARHASAVSLLAGTEALRALGTTFTAAAGLAQRRAVVRAVANA